MLFNTSNKFFKKILLSLGMLFIIIMILGIYFIYTLMRVSQVKEKIDKIDVINQKYDVLKAFSNIENAEVKTYVLDELTSYETTFANLCSSQNISISGCSLEKLKLENLQILNEQLEISIQDVIRFDSNQQ